MNVIGKEIKKTPKPPKSTISLILVGAESLTTTLYRNNSDVIFLKKRVNIYT